jgi:regulatory protein
VNDAASRGAASKNEDGAEGLAAKARTRALRVLARREKSRRGLELLLHRAGFPRATIGAVLDDLAAQGLLDDRRYCRLYLGEQSRLRPRSLRLLQADLRREGIESAVIEEVCREMGAELEEPALALAAARKKLRLSRGDPERLGSLLRARGFGRAAIDEALRTLEVTSDRGRTA